MKFIYKFRKINYGVDYFVFFRFIVSEVNICVLIKRNYIVGVVFSEFFFYLEIVDYFVV